MNSDDIARYLIEHPKFLSTFFAENPALLEAVRVPHPHTGSAISLAERQTLALRDKTRVLEGKLGELISFGEENDAISDKVHRLAVSLLAADDYSAAVRVLYQQMHEDFVVEHVALRLWGRDLPVGAPEAIACNDEQRAYIDTIGGPHCGPSANNPLRTVFGDQAETLASMAVVPLGTTNTFGVLLLASEDDQRFHSAMGMLYLRRIGELLGAALAVRL